MLVQWSCILLAHIQLPAAQKAAGRLLAAQAGPLDALGAHGRRGAAAAERVARLLMRRPDLEPEYLAAVKATGAGSQHASNMCLARRGRQDQHLIDRCTLDCDASHHVHCTLVKCKWRCSAGSPGLAWVLLTFLASDSARLEGHRGALMELYIDKVLGAKERPSPAALAQWAPLAALLTVDDLKVPLLVPLGVTMAAGQPDVSCSCPVLAVRWTCLDGCQARHS